MKFLVIGAITIGIFIVILGGALYTSTKLAEVPSATSTSTASGSGLIKPQHPANGTVFTPPAFHGPTGQPTIVGPSNPPPNY